MIEKRVFEQFETEDKNWKVGFDLGAEDKRGEHTIAVNFVLNKLDRTYLTNEDIKLLKRDIMDLGKFRIILQGRRFLKD